MTSLRRVLARLIAVVTRPRGDRDLDDEIAAHLDMATSDYERTGLSPADARLAAVRHFGGVVRTKQQYRDARGIPAFDAVAADLTQGARALWRHRGFSAGAIATLALGLAAMTTMFSVVYGVMLRPLPYPDADRLMRVWEEHPGGTPLARQRWLSHRTYHAWLSRATTVDRIGAYSAFTARVELPGSTTALPIAAVTPAIFDLVGATTVLGRFFSEQEAAEPRPGVAVLSERLWRERFDANPGVLGTTVIVDEVPLVVVGVAAADLTFPDGRVEVGEASNMASDPRVQLWLPFVIPSVEADNRTTRVFTAIARLSAGAWPAQAADEGTATARSVDRPLSADLMFGKGGPPVVHVRSLATDTAAPVQPALVALGVAAIIVLLVACANVANLLLARGVARQREIAIRLAAGASRWRLAQQALVECLLLALPAGLIGVAVVFGVVRVLPSLAPPRFPRLEDVQVDGAVLAFAIAISVATALVAAVIPALRSTRLDAASTFRGGDGGTSEGFRSVSARRTRDGLLVLESAFAALLIIGALLAGRSLVTLAQVDAGYDADGVLTAIVTLPRATPPERISAFIDGLLERLQAQPGVVAAGVANTMPMNNMSAVSSFQITRAPGRGDAVTTRALTGVVSPGYPHALRLRLRSGRLFEPDDVQAGVRAMIVNEEFVRRYLEGEVVGRRFENLGAQNKGVSTEIVGVVADVLKDGHDTAAEPEVYFVRSAGRPLGHVFSVAIRTTGDPAAFGPTLRDLARALEPAVAVERVARLDDLVAVSMSQPRFAALTLAALAALGLMLASVGLFAVLSYTVSQRRRELAVRSALGASRLALMGSVLRHGLLITILGVGLGTLAAAWLSQPLQHLLFGIGALDPLSFALAPVMLLLVAIGACLLPALRAGATDPGAVLKME